MSVVGIGVDVVEIGRVERALRRTGGLAERLFTDAERADCRYGQGEGEARFDRLAGRFAAKEAVGKALGTGIRGFAWRDVEVRSDPLGRPGVLLHGGAEELAARLGVTAVHVSLSTSRDLAVASVVLDSG